MSHKLHDSRGERKHQILIVVDKDGNRIGQATREECHKGEGKPHLAFMAFVVDKNKNIILTRRSDKKSLWGGFWDVSVVSHILAGETAEMAANRRGKEELGVETDFTDLGAFYYFAKYNGNSENEYCHVLVGKTKEEISSNPVEIEEIKLVGKDELKKDIKTNSHIYTPWLKLAVEKAFLNRIP